MALFDFLKRKKEIEKHARHNAAALGGAKKSEKKVEPDKSAPRILTGKTKSTTFSFEVIKQPHISEKGSYLVEKDQYVFEVLPGPGGYPNKNEVKKAVEGIYGVDVLSVNVIKIPAKKRRLGRTEGWRKAYKKAIVKIKNGQKIEIL